MDLSPFAWGFAVSAAFSFGIAKGGLPGFGMLGVVLMAEAVPGRASSGVVLPLLITADIMAATAFRRHIDWPLIRRLIGPVFLGIIAGWALMPHIADTAFRPLIGGIVLALVVLQLVRQHISRVGDPLPHSRAFAWGMGLLVGLTTLLANAAGPVATIYLLAVGLNKNQFVHTMAWLFLIVNLSKVPFMLQLGLINPGSLTLNATLLPAVVAGLFLGRRTVDRIPQAAFATVVLSLAGLSAIRLLLS